MALGRAFLTIPILLAMAGCAGGEVRDEPATSGAEAKSNVAAATGGGKAEPNRVPPYRETSPGRITENQTVQPRRKPSRETVADQDMADAGKVEGSLAEPPDDATPDGQGEAANIAAGRAVAGGREERSFAAADGATKAAAPIQPPAADSAGDATAAGHAGASVSDGESPTIANPTVAGVPSTVGGVVSTERTAAVEETTDSVSPDAGSVTAGPGPVGDMGDPGADDLNRLAALPPDSFDGDATTETGEEPKGKLDDEDRSLQCDVVELLGRSIGQWRLRGEEQKSAADKAIDEVVRATGSERDRRFVFGGRVYGMLIYELKQDHTSDGFGAYAHAACLILRGHRGLIPTDDTSAAQLDQALRSCESGAPGADELNDCISGRMEQIVRERGRPSG